MLFYGFITINAETKCKLDGIKLQLPKPIILETGSDKINLEESEGALNHVKEYLNAKKYITVRRIEKHDQRTGNEEKLQTLTEKRALAISIG